MIVSATSETVRSIPRLMAMVERGGVLKWKSSIGTSAIRLSSVWGPTTSWFAGTMVTASPCTSGNVEDPPDRFRVQLIVGDNQPGYPFAMGDLFNLVNVAEIPGSDQLWSRFRLTRRVREIADQVQVIARLIDARETISALRPTR